MVIVVGAAGGGGEASKGGVGGGVEICAAGGTGGPTVDAVTLSESQSYEVAAQLSADCIAGIVQTLQ